MVRCICYTVGSLFDGSGGFPLAGALCGFEPRCASEVEPYPIAVTKSRFPNMKHLGNISNVNGGKIEPVDIITFGSPCQDLSVAGKRAGLKHESNGDDETTRSGLFMEAVRIIKEMREATNGVYPTFAIWENVPGAFSSNGGEDFRIVLEELIKIVEPTAVMPAVSKGGWAYADSFVGDGWSLAYRVFDAQYWGVPQRRRRIYLVADFRGERAQEILFKREGLRWYFETGRTPWQAASSNAQGSAVTDDREGEVAVGFDAYQHHGWRKSKVGSTLTAGQNNSVRVDTPLVVVPYTLKIRSGCEGGGKGALVQENLSATLATNNDQYLFQPVMEPFCKSARPRSADDATVWKHAKVANTFNTFDLGETRCNELVVQTEPVYCLQGNGIDRADTAGCNGKGWNDDGEPAVVFKTYQNVTGPLMANSHPGSYTGQDAFSDMLVAGEEPAAAYGLDRASFNQGQNEQFDFSVLEEQQPTITARGPGAVCHENSPHYIVRRLTPTECARLQGFPDWWGIVEKKDSLTDEEYRFWLDVRNTHAAINGKKVQQYTAEQMLTWYNKLWTDSSEYKMWGNGIALPCALYVMQGIADALQKKGD